MKISRRQRVVLLSMTVCSLFPEPTVSWVTNNNNNNDHCHTNIRRRYSSCPPLAGRATPVEQVNSTTGDTIATFSSARKAAREAGVSDPIMHKRCMETRVSTRNGFSWRYVGEKNPNARAVEQVDPTTGAVMATFSSITQAAKAVGACPENVQQVLSGEQRQAGGFFWRDVGSNQLPRPAKRHMGPMEQVDLNTGNIVATYPSMSEAARSSSVAVSSISYVVRGRYGQAGGYFWRRAGSKTPPPDQHRLSLVAVEQLDTEGKVLASFSSFAEASKRTGVDSGNICSVVRGKRRQAGGFFWRHKGSTNKPKPRLPRTSREVAVEQLDQDGNVVELFYSITNANSKTGISQGTISTALRFETKAGGFFWRRVDMDSLLETWPVEQLDMDDGKVVASFPSITAASKTTGIEPIRILKATQSQKKEGNKAGGFFWRRIERES